tara:strand:- start:238 stop:615 length:378 start_codon:yes stop_codon:yes gene_type:complete
MEIKLKRNLAVQVIKDHNISKIEIDYSGGGDDGCVEEVRFEDIDGNNIDVQMENEVETEWDDLLYNMLSDNIEWDWINNDGGYGQMHIDCTKTPWKVNINHTQRICEDHYYDDIDFSTDNKQHFF